MIRIPEAIREAMVREARERLPHEACGLLAGIDGEVREIYPLTNTDASREHFSMDLKEQFAAVKDMRAKGISMLAIWHSHPETPARPSEEDIRLALTPGVSHVIVSLADPSAPDVKSFRIEGGTVSAEPIEPS